MPTHVPQHAAQLRVCSASNLLDLGSLDQGVVIRNLKALESLVVELALVTLGIPVCAAEAVAAAALKARQAELLTAGRHIAPAAQ